MMADEMATLWDRRRTLTSRFIAQPERFQECEHCRSIILKRFGICLYCGSYRFLDDPERIRTTAREMATRPYGLMRPVVPRLGLQESASVKCNPPKPEPPRNETVEFL